MELLSTNRADNSPLLSNRFITIITLCLLAYLTTTLIGYDHNSHLPESRINVEKVFFKPDHPNLQDVDSGYGVETNLPHHWQEMGHAERRKESGTGWYTALIPLNVPPNRLWVVYFPNISAHSTVYINGEVLGKGSHTSGRIAGQMRQHPLFLTIPNGILRADENVLQVYVRSGHAFFGAIEPFFLGPESAFKKVYSNQYFFEVSLVKLIGFLLFFTALATGVIWLLRKRETLYGWFAFSCLLWSLHILTHFHVDIDSTLSYGKFLFRYISIAWFSVMLVFVVHRYQGIHPKKQEFYVVSVGLIVTATLLVAPSRLLHILSNLMVGALALTLISYSFFSLLRNYFTHGKITDCLVAYSVAVIFFFSIADLIACLNPDGDRYSGMTAHYGAPGFIFVLGWKLIKDFVVARNSAEDLNRSLEKRVTERTLQLQKNYAKLDKMKKQQILTQERDRLIMDMHDGLGGQLMSAMSMLAYDEVDRREVSRTIQDAIADLRIMIESLDPECEDLAIVLGGFRQRLERTLEKSGTTLVWNIGDVPNTNGMVPHNTIQILRILQEAVTNALKYSEADTITVSNGVENGRVFISVQDNGKGMHTSDHTPGFDSCDKNGGEGRGLSNMQRRADILSANLIVRSTDEGVLVKLIW